MVTRAFTDITVYEHKLILLRETTNFHCETCAVFTTKHTCVSAVLGEGQNKIKYKMKKKTGEKMGRGVSFFLERLTLETNFTGSPEASMSIRFQAPRALGHANVFIQGNGGL